MNEFGEGQVPLDYTAKWERPITGGDVVAGNNEVVTESTIWENVFGRDFTPEDQISQVLLEEISEAGTKSSRRFGQVEGRYLADVKPWVVAAEAVSYLSATPDQITSFQAGDQLNSLTITIDRRVGGELTEAE